MGVTNGLFGLEGPGTILPIDQSLGAHLMLPLGEKGSINLAYLWLDSNEVINSGSSLSDLINRMVVYGGDLNYKFGNFEFTGAYAVSNLNYNDDSVIDEDNASWYLGLGYETKNWGLGVAYHSIDPFYFAPGAWGRLGIMWNPADVEGFVVDGHVNLGERMKLSGYAKFMHGRETDNSELTKDDKLNQFMINLEYKMSDASSAYVKYEGNTWDFDGSSDNITFNWFTLGFNFDLSKNTNLRMFWQVSDADFGGSGFRWWGSGEAKGGLIGTQLSVKF
jgi:predicted porin